MAWVSRIWGGPFRTPPLQHPVTVGWVLLKLFETIWRLFLILIIGGSLALIGVRLSQERPLSSQIKVQLATHSPDCNDPEYPVRVALTNESDKTLGEIDLAFRLYERGKSVNVAAYSAGSELHDIVKPHYGFQYCFRMPKVEAGTTPPYTIAADVTYAAEISDDVPVTAEPPAPIVTPIAPPPIVRTNILSQDQARPKKRTGWTKVGDVVGVIVCLALFALGGFGLLLLTDRILGTRLAIIANSEPKNADPKLGMFALFGMGNMLLVVAVSYALSAAGLYGWIDRIDQWSRSSGYADGGIMLLTALACQWPWLVLQVVPHSRGHES